MATRSVGTLLRSELEEGGVSGCEERGGKGGDVPDHLEVVEAIVGGTVEVSCCVVEARECTALAGGGVDVAAGVGVGGGEAGAFVGLGGLLGLFAFGHCGWWWRSGCGVVWCCVKGRCQGGGSWRCGSRRVLGGGVYRSV